MDVPRYLRLIISLILIFVGIICALNANTYNEVANKGQQVGDVTPSGARTLMWFNIIFAILTFVLGMWYIWTSFVAPEKAREQLNNYYEMVKSAPAYVKSAYNSLPEDSFYKAGPSVLRSPRRSALSGGALA